MEGKKQEKGGAGRGGGGWLSCSLGLFPGHPVAHVTLTCPQTFTRDAAKT